MHEYLNKIHAFIERLDKDTRAALAGISKPQTYKKGETLLRQNEICRYSFTVEKGILRKFYHSDGKEITTEFFFADDIAVSFDSYCHQKPGSEFIQALTDTNVLQTEYNAFQNAKIKFPKLIELDLLLTEYYAMWLEKRLFDFHTLDATQRYVQLINEQTHILQNIPLTYIASYLGISLETLSRIRAKI
ncbi:MAG: Crp/Fnr family transcriptional regulator [Saprospiraceae bacterium]|nr:Crp/Fnr family transcriptional regulator [Saprospiraceae bacterium]